MRWEDERYVRLYTRDTTDWLALSFDAQALLALVLRKVDRAGLMPLGRHGRRGVAIAIGHPGLWERLAPALEELLADGCVRLTEDGQTLLVPNFLAAQEARASDKARQQKAREVARDTAAVTRRDTPSQNVTESHTPSHAVTESHTPSRLAVPSRTVPSCTEDLAADAAPPDGNQGATVEHLPQRGETIPFKLGTTQGAQPTELKPKERKRKQEGDPRHQPLKQALLAIGYPWRDGRDGKAIQGLLQLADQNPATVGEAASGEVLRRAKIAWERQGYPACRSLTELHQHWGHFANSQTSGGSAIGGGRATPTPVPKSEWEQKRLAAGIAGGTSV